jgi:hypothetical protein
LFSSFAHLAGGARKMIETSPDSKQDEKRQYSQQTLKSLTRRDDLNNW